MIYFEQWVLKQMFVPNGVMGFGSTYKLHSIKTSRLPKTYTEYLQVHRTHRKYLDHPQERCSNEAQAPNMTACIAEYIAAQIGCSVKIQEFEPTNFPSCKTEMELEAFVNISRKLEQSGATGVYDTTGCLSSCEKVKYDLWLENWPESKNRKKHSEVLLIFTIYERSYQEEEQYIIYDSNSFFADIGGFMGLVLGSSMLNIYDEVVGLLRRLKIGLD